MLPEPDPRLLHDLREALGEARVLATPLDRLARSADASIYRLVPEAVVRPRDRGQVRALFQLARRHGRSLTFRAAGTSLSGSTPLKRLASLRSSPSAASTRSPWAPP